MPGAVLDRGEVLLNSIPYPLKGTRLQNGLVSLYPRKVLIGDVKSDDQQRASTYRISDWRDGIGNYKSKKDDPGAPDCWWSTCQLRQKDQLVLPRLATLTAASGVAGSYNVNVLIPFANEMYATFGTVVRKFNNTTDSWGSTLHTLPGTPTDAITLRMPDGTTYLVIACGASGYSYTSDGAAWTDDTTSVQYLTSWKNWLWGISSTGQLWRSSVIGTEDNDAQLPLPNSSVNDLFVGRNAAGALVIFSTTRVGLYVHNYELGEWVQTEIELPEHPDNGKGSGRWRDSIYITSGLGVYRYIQGNNRAEVSVMGLDRNDGVPSDKRGIIRQLVGTHTELLAITDATTAPGSLDMFDGLDGGSVFGPSVIDPDVGFSYIAGWDGQGWQIWWLGGDSATAITAAVAASAYDVYRLWWAHNQRVYHMALPRDITNPLQVTTQNYAASGEHITAWFDADQADIDKLALQLRVEVEDTSANESVAVEYATNYNNSTWSSLGTITSDGITTYNFPDSTTPNGTAFRSIRFRLSLARGSTTTLTPVVVSISFIYRKKLLPKWGQVFTIDMTQEYKGRSPKELRAELLTAVETTTLVEFTFRDAEDPRVFYVDVLSATGFEETGLDESGESTVMVAEP